MGPAPRDAGDAVTLPGHSRAVSPTPTAPSTTASPSTSQLGDPKLLTHEGSAAVEGPSWAGTPGTGTSGHSPMVWGRNGPTTGGRHHVLPPPPRGPAVPRDPQDQRRSPLPPGSPSAALRADPATCWAFGKFFPQNHTTQHKPVTCCSSSTSLLNPSVTAPTQAQRHRRHQQHVEISPTPLSLLGKMLAQP